eukprot:197804-Chlamydomonas_euryale.AAC.3
MQKTGLASAIYNAFGEPEILDDLLDHWSASVHKQEKIAILHMFQVRGPWGALAVAVVGKAGGRKGGEEAGRRGGWK